ncbi:unnamed protein product [Cercospora beticola]|nr:unnamed protein product [Cercospora beticola]
MWCSGTLFSSALMFALVLCHNSAANESAYNALSTVQDPTCRCGASAFLSSPHTNISKTEPVDRCFDYRLLDARGTAEPQGVSSMFQSLIAQVLANRTGGYSQPVVYPADPDQNTTSGQGYLLRQLEAGVRACPRQKFVILGYSQGASLILEASTRFDQFISNAIAAIILVGNPYRIPEKKSSVNSRGLPDKRATIGRFAVSALSTGSNVPQLPLDLDTSGKVLDYCLEHDTVCSIDPACDCQLPADHLSYGLIQTVQETAFEHIIQALASN